ncbi:MAG: hypothetical protein V7K89_16850 [Nostoc sp.]|uniref:hypothetical protein n=1 Tax=Nostoc sp. TaxID=1180 RepID=UPI002FF7BD7F
MKTKDESDLGSLQQTTIYFAVGTKLARLQNPELSTILHKSVAFLMHRDALALQRDASTLYRDALALHRDALALQSIAFH